MKLIRQETLLLRQGSMDKVYELDLCEVGPDKYVVNFRFGKRGSALRDGSKTTLPVSREKAEALFERTLSSQRAKGYHLAGASAAQAAEPVSDEIVVAQSAASGGQGRAEGVLARLAQGARRGARWSLSRAVWRAGEMRLAKAEPLLLEQLTSAQDSMLQYCLVWALARCGSEPSIAALREFNRDETRAEPARRLAAAAILELIPSKHREQANEQILAGMPEQLAELARNGPSDGLYEALQSYLDPKQPTSFSVLERLYLVDNRFIRPAMLRLLATVPLKAHYFRRLRRIFKVAEMRDDDEVFGILGYRFERSPRSVMLTGWHRRQLKSKGDAGQYAFTQQTRIYLRRRVWRTLKRLGELDDPRYVPMAAGVLAVFTDEDAQPPRQTTHWVPTGEGYRYRPETRHWDRFGSYWAFNNILYGRSTRYAPDRTSRAFYCRPPFAPGGVEPVEREESFPELWERAPEQAIRLLDLSRCKPVHHFAVKLLRAMPRFCRGMAVDALLVLIQAPYDVTVTFGLELAVQRYDPEAPDLPLVLGLANSVSPAARQQAITWMQQSPADFLHDSDFVVGVIFSPHPDMRHAIRELLRQAVVPEAQARDVLVRLIAALHELEPEQGELAGDACETLLRIYGGALRRIGPDVIRDLLGHPLPEIQQFAGDLVLGHETLSQSPPADILQALLDSDHPGVRGVGVRIISQLPEHVLVGNSDLLMALLRHREADIREAIRPTVVRLAEANADFARRISEALVDSLLVPGAAEGVPSFTSLVLREELRSYLSHLPSSKVWQLLESRSGPAQEVGGVLLADVVDPAEVTVQQLVRLANHEILSVREACWKLCGDKVQSLRGEPGQAARLLDARWEDSRQFGFAFFREHFVDSDMLTPTVLVALCDSVRPDVQQFGREMITRLFREEDGAEFAIKLSEHPAQSMQQFASNFLDAHVAGHPDRLQQMQPYFLSALSRVNEGRVVKDRVFLFLEREALANRESAEVVAEMMERQSATAAIGDKSQTLTVMARIQARWPDLALPIQQVPTEVRDGV